MSAILNSNLDALRARLRLAASGAAEAQALERLASGLRVNTARDDAAGLAISERMLAQVRGLAVAGRNARDAISLAQTADGALGSIGANLQRIRELAVQAANATQSASDRAALQAEASQLVQEIDRVAAQTSFNGLALLDGSFGAGAFQVGAGSGLGQTITLAALNSARSTTLGLTPGAPTTPPPTTTTVTGSGLGAGSVIDAAGELVINGVDVFQGTTVTADAADIAAAINAAGIGGLTATAAPLVIAGAWAATSDSQQDVRIDVSTYEVGVGLSHDRNYDVGSLVNFFNYYYAVYVDPTLTAFDNGSGASLVRANGHNIALGQGIFGTGLAGIGLGGVPGEYSPTMVTSYSTYTVSYTGTAGLTIAGTRAAVLGLPPLTPPPPPATGGTAAIAAIDISSVAGANAALASIDVALAAVDAARAGLGAAQSRFSAAIENIGNASENTAAARGRIVDADFASETTALARSRILQSAGLAMVAQANAEPSWVLALLKGS